jgi:hypothetical protein
MPSGPFPQLCTTVDGQQYSIEMLSISDDGNALAPLGRMQPSPFTELLLITPPDIPVESPLRRRGPMSIIFSRAGDAKDINVEELSIAPDDGAVLVTVHAPWRWKDIPMSFSARMKRRKAPRMLPGFSSLARCWTVYSIG